MLLRSLSSLKDVMSRNDQLSSRAEDNTTFVNGRKQKQM